MITPPLPHRASVSRNTESGTAASGQPLPGEFAELHEALPCFFWEGRALALELGQGGLREGNVNIVAEGPRLLVRRSADIGIADVVTEVRMGEEVIATGMRVVEDLWRQGHREVALERVANPFVPPEGS